MDNQSMESYQDRHVRINRAFFFKAQLLPALNNADKGQREG
jgi:hypothetical protein